MSAAPSITFNCLYPPSSNTIFSGRRFKTAAYKKWRRDAGWFVKANNPIPLPQFPATDLQVKIELPQKMRAGDIDNRIKALFDVFVDLGVMADDRLVSDLRILYVPIISTSAARLTLSPAI